jgi:phage shock protein A
MTPLNQLKQQNRKLQAELTQAIAAADEATAIAARAIKSRNDYAHLASTREVHVQELESLNLELCQQSVALHQRSEQLHGNLMAFRDRFKARVSEMQMESRFWQIDIGDLLEA